MKKNNLSDFDFIKDKFNAVEAEPPSSLNTSVIYYKILSKEQHKAVKFEQKKKSSFKTLVAVAACFVLIAGLISASAVGDFGFDRANTFHSYEELYSATEKLDDSAPPSGGGSFEAHEYSKENEKSTPDLVKSDGKYVYYSDIDYSKSKNKSRIYIAELNGDNSKTVSVIDNIESESEYDFKNILLYNDRLIVNLSNQNTTLIKIYNTENKSAPILLKEFEQSGSYVNSHIKGDTFYIVSHYAVTDNKSPIPVSGFKKNANKINAENIAYFENSLKFSYSVIGSFNIDKMTSETPSKAVLGSDGGAYFASDGIYFAKYTEGIINDKIFDSKNNTYKQAPFDCIRLDIKKNKFEKITPRKTIELLNERGENTAKYGANSVLIKADENRLLVFCENEKSLTLTVSLYDTSKSSPSLLDRLDTDWMFYPDSVSANEEKGIYAFAGYKTDENRRNMGALAFKAENDKIIITDQFTSGSGGNAVTESCIITGDYLYTFDIDRSSKGSESLIIYPFKYS